jgi:ribosomal protein L11 methylase PrmA
MLKKMELVEKFLGLASGSTIWDMGANQGNFSRIAKGKGMFILSMDVDPSAVELNYRKVRSDKETDIHPLVIDLTNPSPSLGWMGVERMGLMERGPADIVFALALIHHLAITNNVSLGMLCDFFARLCRWLIIEFVPKSDSQVKRLLFTREDIFPGYTQDGFEKEFSRRFRVVEQSAIEGTERTLYLMERL